MEILTKSMGYVMYLAIILWSQATVSTPTTQIVENLTTTINTIPLSTADSACPVLACDNNVNDPCIITTPISFTCDVPDIDCTWTSNGNVNLNAKIGVDSLQKCLTGLTWNVNGTFRMLSNASIDLSYLNVTSTDFIMEDKSLLQIENTLSLLVSQRFRTEQDAKIIAGGLWPGHAGGIVNISSGSIVLHGEIRASGGEGICIDGSCTPGGHGGYVSLRYTSVATETGSIVVSGGADPLGGTLSPNINLNDFDDVTPDCLSGAAGQILRIYDSEKSKDGFLVVSNGFNGPNSQVRRCATIVLDTMLLDLSIKRVLIESESLVHFHGNAWGLKGDSELIIEDATVVGDPSAPLDIFVRQLVVRGSAVLYAAQGIRVSSDILSIDFGARVAWGANATAIFDVADSVQINGNVTSMASHGSLQQVASSGFLFISSGGDVVLGGSIIVPSCYVMSKSNMVLTGLVEANARVVDDLQYQPCSSLPSKSTKSWTQSYFNYTIVMTSAGSIDIGHETNGQRMSGSAILLCSNQSIRVTSKSIVTSSGSGYSGNSGIGAGDCVARIGGGGGYGGNGGSSVKVVGSQILKSNSEGGVSYGSRSSSGYLGSGGGCPDGGAGGGIVMMEAIHIELNGSILANGDNGITQGGGGSGGYVGLTISNGLFGNGFLSAIGGNTTCAQDDSGEKNLTWQCGGGGGGGRLRLLGCHNFSECTSSFTGNYSVIGGESNKNYQSGETGTYFGFPCPPGYGGLLCRLCDIGTFKEERGSAECLNCKNKPLNSYYIGNGSTTLNCRWRCNPGYTGDLQCLSPLDDFFNMFGGKLIFICFASSILLTIIGLGCFFKKDPHGRDIKFLIETDHLVMKKPWYYIDIGRIVWPRVGYPKLQEKDVEKHFSRIYFSGDNLQNNPLKFQNIVPKELKPVLEDDKFYNLAEQMNSILSFSTSENLFYNFIKIICFPFSNDFLLYKKHKKFNTLKRSLSKYNHECMKGYRSKAWANCIKLGYCSDYSLVYLEFLHRENDPIPLLPLRVGKPHLPMVLLFSGMGTYESPLYLDPNDILVRSVSQSPELTAFIDELWIEILAEINSILRIIELKNKNLNGFLLITKLCELNNGEIKNKKKILNLGGLKMHLGRFYPNSLNNSYKWGLFLTSIEIEKNINGNQIKNKNQKSNISIRDEALDDSPFKYQPRQIGIIQEWNRSVDDTLPIPGILVTSDELHERQIYLNEKIKYKRYLWKLLPHNVLKSPTISQSWIISISLGIFLLFDLITTLGILVNLKCVENGMEMHSCTKSVVFPVLFIYPFAIVISPICGILALALSSPIVARKYGLWNSCSILNILLAIIISYIQSDKLVAPYVTRPIPLLPCFSFLLKILQFYFIDIYIADVESTRRRRGWRGLMKRRDSDTSTPPTSPYQSPRQEIILNEKDLLFPQYGSV